MWFSRLFFGLNGTAAAPSTATASPTESPSPTAPPSAPTDVAELSGAAAAPSTSAASPPEAPAPTAPPTAPTHLVVLQNGLFGSRYNWDVIAGLLRTHLDSSTTLVHVSQANEFRQTYGGIDTCGSRLAAEVAAVAAATPSLRRISFLAHSMGGLISRYAAAELYDRETGSVAGLRPTHFITLATPHLGCESDPGPAQVPLVAWLGAVPGAGAVSGAISAPVAATLFRRTGSQFFLLDRDEGRPPLLYRMSRDEDDAQEGSGGGLPFRTALEAFETRTCYANRSGDHLVGWANSSLRAVHELPKIKVEKASGVVREDPLEAAWWPEARPGVEARGAAAGLEPERAHSAGAADVLMATSPEDLVRREGHGSSSGGAAVAAAPTDSSAASVPAALGPDASSREYIDAALASLAGLPWRRVDVCFGGAALPLLAHQHLQVQRLWANWAGLATAKHIALQLAAMEELREQHSGEGGTA